MIVGEEHAAKHDEYMKGYLETGERHVMGTPCTSAGSELSLSWLWTKAYICCMFVDTKTKLGILLYARKITFGVKSRVRYVPDLSLWRAQSHPELWYRQAYTKVTRIWIFRTSGVSGWDQKTERAGLVTLYETLHKQTTTSFQQELRWAPR
jgi:hypothetical protein